MVADLACQTPLKTMHLFKPCVLSRYLLLVCFCALSAGQQPVYPSATHANAHEIELRVVDRYGIPIRKATATYATIGFGLEGRLWSCLESGPKAKEVVDGRCSLSPIASERPTYVRLSCPGYAHTYLYWLYPGYRYDVCLDYGASAEFKVYDENGEPAAFVDVTATIYQKASIPKALKIPIRSVSDAEGRVWLSHLQSGEYEVLAKSKDGTQMGFTLIGVSEDFGAEILESASNHSIRMGPAELARIRIDGYEGESLHVRFNFVSSAHGLIETNAHWDRENVVLTFGPIPRGYINRILIGATHPNTRIERNPDGTWPIGFGLDVGALRNLKLPVQSLGAHGSELRVFVPSRDPVVETPTLREAHPADGFFDLGLVEPGLDYCGVIVKDGRPWAMLKCEGDSNVPSIEPVGAIEGVYRFEGVGLRNAIPRLVRGWESRGRRMARGLDSLGVHVTDPAGNLSVVGLAQGHYKLDLHAHKTPYEESMWWGLVESGEKVEFEVNLSYGARLSGRVVMDDGTIVSAGSIYVLAVDGGRDNLKPVFLNPDGTFEVFGLRRQARYVIQYSPAPLSKMRQFDVGEAAGQEGFSGAPAPISSEYQSMPLQTSTEKDYQVKLEVSADSRVGRLYRKLWQN